MKIKTTETVFHYKTEDVHIEFTKSNGEEVDKWIRKPRPIEGKSHTNEIMVVLDGVKIGRAGRKVHFAYVHPNTKVVDGVVQEDPRWMTVCGTETYKSRVNRTFGEANRDDITCEKCEKRLDELYDNGRIIDELS